MQLDHIDDLFPKEAEINLYRIVQESVNNILKHSHASRATIAVKREAHILLVTVADNGKGFDSEDNAEADPQRQGFGLTGILERARMLGGKPLIHSAPGKGTTISLRLELQDGKHDD
jgi:signal transduction histidine kinase